MHEVVCLGHVMCKASTRWGTWVAHVPSSKAMGGCSAVRLSQCDFVACCSTAELSSAADLAESHSLCP